MPIYEYRCESCLGKLEKIQKLSDPALIDCPQCGNPSLVKLISASSFRLKGSGWYETDFKTGTKKNGAGESTSVGAEENTSKNTGETKTSSSDVSASVAGSGNSNNTKESSASNKPDSAKNDKTVEKKVGNVEGKGENPPKKDNKSAPDHTTKQKI